jgi:hypothetical protein
MSEERDPYEENQKDYWNYCFKCCYDDLVGCLPDYMCPGCNCQSICMDLGDPEDVFNDCRYYDDCR